ncbi:hypothetical protein FOXG_14238 [Fusarium oxysporum f. sp. lycopersici 4287]|uniref:Uncharacterized protein n=1 Tax=Fusarium oxysporum f. sp. lycopersici (strain 4287 / CBS 123668 / FGSC 9935 / NRRL 34936) TaxID=426428 RepID=A0A0J9WTE8_FUSO4|nr:hypothetical protein FOXG_14238 [Fusarium oxysporum f. sp. lycopersici 4287]KNB15907.1 hypothetical protein FOXG_14238 [Fusarium oxysporum f. sp. lycopersici 4287]
MGQSSNARQPHSTGPLRGQLTVPQSAAARDDVELSRD